MTLVAVVDMGAYERGPEIIVLVLCTISMAVDINDDVNVLTVLSIIQIICDLRFEFFFQD